LQNYQKNLINFRYVPNLYKDRYSDADFTAEKLMKSSLICPWISIDFFLSEPFRNLNQSNKKISARALLASGQGLIKLKRSNQNGTKSTK